MDRIWRDDGASSASAGTLPSAPTRTIPRSRRPGLRPIHLHAARQNAVARVRVRRFGYLLQLAQHVACCLPSLVRILGETAAHDVVERRRHQRLK